MTPSGCSASTGCMQPCVKAMALPYVLGGGRWPSAVAGKQHAGTMGAYNPYMDKKQNNMKRLGIPIILVIALFSLPRPAAAQTEEIAQLLLNVEKLAQFKQILTDMKKGYDILNGGYRTVKQLTEGNFSLHRVFLDGLMEVSPAV